MLIKPFVRRFDFRHYLDWPAKFFCVEIFAGEGLVNRWRRETSLSGSQKKQQQLYKLDLEKSHIRYFWSNTLSLPASVTRLSDLLNFGQLFKAVGNN